jgi:hypothetical protein
MLDRSSFGGMSGTTVLLSCSRSNSIRRGKTSPLFNWKQGSCSKIGRLWRFGAAAPTGARGLRAAQREESPEQNPLQGRRLRR